MTRPLGLTVWFALVGVDSEELPKRAEEGEAAEVLNRFLAAEQTGVMQDLGNWLESYALSERQVDKLVAAAEAATAEERRNLLWHALRCARSRTAREFLMRTLVDDTDETTKIRFVKSLTNLAPFDVLLLTSLYQSGRAAKQPINPDTPSAPNEVVRATQPGIQDEIVMLATRGTSALAAELSYRPKLIGDRHELIYIVREQRSKQAQQAKAELLTWLAKNAATEEHRLMVIEPALEILDKAHQKQLAADVLAIVKNPQARANVIPKLCRLYALDAYPLLVKDEEEEIVKLGIIRGLHMLASTYGYTLGSIAHGRPTLQYVSQNDPSSKVRDAAKQLLQRISGSGRDPFEEEPPTEKRR